MVDSDEERRRRRRRKHQDSHPPQPTVEDASDESPGGGATHPRPIRLSMDSSRASNDSPRSTRADMGTPEKESRGRRKEVEDEAPPSWLYNSRSNVGVPPNNERTDYQDKYGYRSGSPRGDSYASGTSGPQGGSYRRDSQFTASQGDTQPWRRSESDAYKYQASEQDARRATYPTDGPEARRQQAPGRSESRRPAYDHRKAPPPAASKPGTSKLIEESRYPKTSFERDTQDQSGGRGHRDTPYTRDQGKVDKAPVPVYNTSGRYSDARGGGQGPSDPGYVRMPSASDYLSVPQNTVSRRSPLPSTAYGKPGDPEAWREELRRDRRNEGSPYPSADPKYRREQAGSQGLSGEDRARAKGKDTEFTRGEGRRAQRESGSPYPKANDKYRKESAGKYDTASGQSRESGDTRRATVGQTPRGGSRQPSPYSRTQRASAGNDRWSAEIPQRESRPPADGGRPPRGRAQETVSSDATLRPLDASQQVYSRQEEERSQDYASSRRNADQEDLTQISSDRLRTLTDWREARFDEIKSMSSKVRSDLKAALKADFKKNPRDWDKLKYKLHDAEDDLENNWKAMQDRSERVTESTVSEIYQRYVKKPSRGFPSSRMSIEADLIITSGSDWIELTPTFTLRIDGEKETRQNEGKTLYKKSIRERLGL